MSKIRLGIIFGGRSKEHEISIMSAASVLSVIDQKKYEAIPFAIDKKGVWHIPEADLCGISELSDPLISGLFTEAAKVSLTDFDEMTDFALPLLHGPFGEDGTIQGMFEMMDKPYAGCGVASSSVSMDKIFTKDIWRNSGLPVSDYTYITRDRCADGFAAEADRIEKALSYPLFVKPANMGSSVGVSKAENRADLEQAIAAAMEYDRRIIVEEAINGRELEIGVIGNETPAVSVVGEILPENEYYDFHSKYKAGGTRLIIPADIPENVRESIYGLAISAYKAIDGEGFARTDLFYDEKQGKIYLNEINTIPGMTKYSMFPSLWQAKGVGFEELIERIIGFGYERYNASHHRQPASRA